MNDIALSVLDCLAVPVMVLDEAGRVILFNRAAQALTGCEFASVMARRPLGRLGNAGGGGAL